MPIIRLVGLSEVECRALMIADNRIAEKSVWDPLLLKAELQKLVDIQFDMDDIGFDAAELDLCLDHDADGRSPTRRTRSNFPIAVVRRSPKSAISIALDSTCLLAGIRAIRRCSMVFFLAKWHKWSSPTRRITSL